MIGDTIQEKLPLARKIEGDVPIEVLGTWTHQGVAAAVAAGIGYTKDIVVEALQSFAAERSNLGQRSNRKVQMKMLRDSFSQSGRKTLIPSTHMMLYSEVLLAAILVDFPSSMTVNNDPEVEPCLDYFQLQTTSRHLPHRTPWMHQNCSDDEDALAMTAAAGELDQPVGFVHERTADATVSVASHIVGGGRIVPMLHLVVEEIESGIVRVHMVSVLDTAVAYECPY